MDEAQSVTPSMCCAFRFIHEVVSLYDLFRVIDVYRRARQAESHQHIYAHWVDACRATMSFVGWTHAISRVAPSTLLFYSF